MKPQGNGVVELHENKSIKERGFCCMKLIEFLSYDGVTDWEDWHGAHLLAQAGECQYRSRCTIYERTKKSPIQLNLR